MGKDSFDYPDDYELYVKKLNLYRIKACIPFEFVGIGSSEENARSLAHVFGRNAAEDAILTHKGGGAIELDLKGIRIGEIKKIKTPEDLPANFDSDEQPYGDPNWELGPCIGDWLD